MSQPSEHISDLEKAEKLAKLEASLGFSPLETDSSSETEPAVETLKLSQIAIYPVKSIAAISLSSSWVEKQGLTFDRRFMLADENGRMITAREHHSMLKITAALQPDGLILTHPDCTPLRLDNETFALEEIACSVWSDNFSAYTTTDEANQWFSHILAKPVQLLFCGKQSKRVRSKIATNVSFADGYPQMLLSQASLDELNRRSSQQHVMAQFRPNLVVSGCEAFAEDSWQRIRIGEVEFEVIKPCMRCVLTTVSPETAVRKDNNEPLKTLSTFRANAQGGIFFGQNLVAKNEGMIRVDDVVEVLQYKSAEVYPDNQSASTVEQVSKALTININGDVFTGENQTTLLEQAEAAGIELRNSCRSGFCGACKVSVVSGEVEQPEMPALMPAEIAQGKVLACCCVPKSDVEFSV